MPRAPRDHRLHTRSARARLKPRRDPYWQQLQEGLFLGYRKGTRQGTWYIRTYEAGRYRKRRLATADDHTDADGLTVLDHRQAARAAMGGIAAEQVGGYTVGDALDDYLTEFATRAKSYDETKRRADRDIRPPLGRREVERLSAAEIRRWHHALARTDDPDPDAPRRRQATANRCLTVLKAALNQAYHDGKVPLDTAWRRVRPFRHVDQPRIRHLTHNEAIRLVNASDPDFRPLARAALLTGCRYGELSAMRVEDFDPASRTVQVRGSKGGGSRHVWLTDEGAELFERLTAGRARGEPMFIHADGGSWGRSHQTRPMRVACERAGIDPPVGFHILRHTYGSLLAAQGVPLQVIAHALGHADTRMTHRHYAHLLPDHVASQIRAALPAFTYEADNVTPMRPRSGR